jgi:plasmid replication initiation protein
MCITFLPLKYHLFTVAKTTYPQKTSHIDCVIRNVLKKNKQIRYEINMNQDLILKTKTPKIYKSKKLNSANFGDFNHSDYQIFLYLVSKLGGVDSSGKYTQEKNLGREFLLSAEELCSMFLMDKSNCYKTLKKSCKKLMKTSIIIEKKEQKETWEINVCSRAIYKPGEGSIYVKFTDDIMPYLVQVKERFMLYNLREISNFASLYTTRLYELLQEFKDNGWMIKSVDQLKEAFSVGSKYKMYAHFKSKTFGPACEEINKNYNMNLRFEEIKEGAKVTAIKFTFKPIAILNVTNEVTGKTRKIYTKHEQKISHPKKQRTRKLVAETIVEKPIKELDSNPEKTRNSGGFFSSLLRVFRKK